ncbi:MAG TPA: helix-turn-helix transcriptional regulator [Pseudonocardiaceae bacterium]|jgi:transcriptional regulator with XRE-family HTH domain|nr:helix-turn-helix transcriptional regulator [Pseudonocardiaceae bacterium]
MTGTREPNLLLRAARRELRETQEQTAAALGALMDRPVDPEYIGRLERGVVTWPNAEYRAALQQHFGVASPGELGLYCRRSQPKQVEADNVRRRVFLNALPLPLVVSSGQSLTSLVTQANAEPDALPRRVGLEHLEQVRILVAQAYELGDRWGGGLVRAMLGAQMRWAVGLLDAHVDPAIAEDLHSEVGWLAAYCGWSCHDVGANTAAQCYEEIALHCAEQADNWTLRAHAYSDLSRMTAHRGDGDTALTLSQHSQIRSDRLTPLNRVCLAAVEARTHGQRGDAQSCLAAVRRAEEHFTSVIPANETATMLAYYSPARLSADSGHALLPLAMRGQHVTTTVELLRSAAESYPAALARPRVLAELRLAALLFAQGDPAEAVAVTTGALDSAGSVRSNRILDLLTELQQLTSNPRHRSVPGIADLRQRITTILVP